MNYIAPPSTRVDNSGMSNEKWIEYFQHLLNSTDIPVDAGHINDAEDCVNK